MHKDIHDIQKSVYSLTKLNCYQRVVPHDKTSYALLTLDTLSSDVLSDIKQSSVTINLPNFVAIVSDKSIFQIGQLCTDAWMSQGAFARHFRLSFDVRQPYIGSGTQRRCPDNFTQEVSCEFSRVRADLPNRNEHARYSLQTVRTLIDLVTSRLLEGQKYANLKNSVIPLNGFLLPPLSAFLQSNLDSTTIPQLQDLMNQFGFPQTDSLIVDPPWPSKSVSRRKVYTALSLESMREGLRDVGRILMHNAVVAVWTTNDPKIIKFVLEDLFPQWGISPITQWVWVKITNSNQPVIPFNNPARKCYERVLVGIKNDLQYAFDPGTIDRFIFSQPCELHSFKPSLEILIDELLPHKLHRPPRVELFARMVKQGYVCWGNQVLLCNHENLWEETL